MFLFFLAAIFRMIRKSFVFIEGIGPQKERALWNRGICDWDAFLAAKNIRGFSKEYKAYANRHIHFAKEALKNDDSAYFVGKLAQVESWRLFNRFKDEVAFLDIETSGFDNGSKITVVGIFDGLRYKSMIEGINMNYKALKEELSIYKMLVTFNGSSFDLPILRQKGVIPNIPHLDLKHACARVGLKGGLKEIERTLGFTRTPIVEGLHGGDALSLWKIYRATGDEHYLNLLLEYNEEDCSNLKPLAEKVCSELSKRVFPLEAKTLI